MGNPFDENIVLFTVLTSITKITTVSCLNDYFSLSSALFHFWNFCFIHFLSVTHLDFYWVTSFLRVCLVITNHDEYGRMLLMTVVRQRRGQILKFDVGVNKFDDFCQLGADLHLTVQHELNCFSIENGFSIVFSTYLLQCFIEQCSSISEFIIDQKHISHRQSLRR